MQSPLITCFLGTATPGRAASKKRFGRYASGTAAAANRGDVEHEASGHSRPVNRAEPSLEWPLVAGWLAAKACLIAIRRRGIVAFQPGLLIAVCMCARMKRALRLLRNPSSVYRVQPRGEFDGTQTR